MSNKKGISLHFLLLPHIFDKISLGNPRIESQLPEHRNQLPAVKSAMIEKVRQYISDLLLVNLSAGVGISELIPK